MQSQVTEDLKGDGEAHTRLILDEVRALRREIEALRGLRKSDRAQGEGQGEEGERSPIVPAASPASPGDRPSFGQDS